MRPLESMREKLKASGIYALSGNTLVDYELEAYASVLDKVYDALEELKKESRTATAGGFGLVLREQQFGLLPEQETQQRRAAVLSLGAVTAKDFTRSDLERLFKEQGFPCEIYESPAEQTILVNCLTPAEEPEKSRMTAIAKTYLPAHLDAELDFRSISWNNIDQQDFTYDCLDGMDSTWDAADNFENAVVKI